MIFLKSNDDRMKEEQELCKWYCDHRKKEFAWLPRLLMNDQIAWLQFVYRGYVVHFNTNFGTYYRSRYPLFFLEDKKRKS